MGTDVRAITDDELPRWGDAMWRGFHHEAVDGWAELRPARLRPEPHDRRLRRRPGRRHAALRSPPRLTVPGGAMLPSAALTNVTVAPTHRRQGLLAAHARPDLAAAEGAGRAGGHADRRRVPDLRPLRLRLGRRPHRVRDRRPHRAVRRSPAPGIVELVDAAELRKQAPALYERLRRVQPGFIERDERWWDRDLPDHAGAGRQALQGLPGRAAATTAARPRATCATAPTASGTSAGRTARSAVDELVAATPGAYARLWRYCCEVDWIARVSAGDRRVGEALPWLVADGRHVVQKWRGRLPVGAHPRRGGRPGRPHATSRRGGWCWRWSTPRAWPRAASPSRAARTAPTCTPTDRGGRADPAAAALGAVYLGGPDLRTLATAGRVDVHDDAALATADAMFRGPVDPLVLHLVLSVLTRLNPVCVRFPVHKLACHTSSRSSARRLDAFVAVAGGVAVRVEQQGRRAPPPSPRPRRSGCCRPRRRCGRGGCRPPPRPTRRSRDRAWPPRRRASRSRTARRRPAPPPPGTRPRRPARPRSGRWRWTPPRSACPRSYQRVQHGGRALVRVAPQVHVEGGPNRGAPRRSRSVATPTVAT